MRVVVCGSRLHCLLWKPAAQPMCTAVVLLCSVLLLYIWLLTSVLLALQTAASPTCFALMYCLCASSSVLLLYCFCTGGC